MSTLDKSILTALICFVGHKPGSDCFLSELLYSFYLQTLTSFYLGPGDGRLGITFPVPLQALFWKFIIGWYMEHILWSWFASAISIILHFCWFIPANNETTFWCLSHYFHRQSSLSSSFSLNSSYCCHCFLITSYVCLTFVPPFLAPSPVSAPPLHPCRQPPPSAWDHHQTPKIPSRISDLRICLDGIRL